MLTTNWSAVAAVFDVAVDLEGRDREDYLSRACAKNTGLRRDVDAMLAADADASGFLDGPILGARVPLVLEMHPGDRIGPYEIVRLIGRGGMGAVYLGQRVEDFERLVAIKMIGGLVPHRAAFRRFLRERQILSTLDHPNIARLFGGGITANGMPYLVMEYVNGLPIDTYCTERKLDLRSRLVLLHDLCEAVAYAHRRLIVHRDLKPGNILVSQDSKVKLLDFGIAKSVGSGSQDKSITEANEVVATLGFACPEQLVGSEVSTSWDVYALGRVFELIVQEPIENEASNLTATSRLSRLRQYMVRRESHLDIRALVRKATKGRDIERYQSAGELGADVQRLVLGNPVSARQLGVGAGALSMIRRNFGVFVLFLLTLVTFVSLMMSSLAMRNDAEERTLVADGLSSYLVSLFEVADPERRLENSISALEVLDRGTQQARANLPHKSPEYIRIIKEIGGLYAKVGAFRQAQNLLSEVLATSVNLDSRFIADAHFELGRVLHTQGGNADAEIHFNLSLSELGRPDADNADLYSNVVEELALVAVDKNLLERADSLADVYLAIRVQWLEPEVQDHATALGLKARVRWRARDYTEAEDLYLRALSMNKADSGLRSLDVASTLNDLGLVYVDMGQFGAADSLLNEALSIKESVLGSGHPSFATTLANLAPVARHRFGVDSAEAIMRNVVSVFIGNFGMDHHEVATAKNNLALTLDPSARADEIEAEYRGALAIWKKTVGDYHPDYLAGCQNLGILLRSQGRYREALVYYHDSVRGFRLLGPNYRTTLGNALNGLAKSYLGAGDARGAAASFRESLAIRQAELPAGHWRIGTGKSLLGETLGLLGEFEEAEDLLISGLEILRAARGPDDEKTLEAQNRLASLYALASHADSHGERL